MISATPGASVPASRIRRAATSTIRSWLRVFSVCEWPMVAQMIAVILFWMMAIIQNLLNPSA